MNSQPVHFQPPTDEPPRVLLPVPSSVFVERAERFTRLAEGHSLSAWLTFLAKLCQAQQAACQALALPALPNAALQTQASKHGMPVLDCRQLPAEWPLALQHIIATLQALPNETVPAPVRAACLLLEQADATTLDAMAQSLLHGAPMADAISALPLVAAALQVVYTLLSSQLEAKSLVTMTELGVCPCCGSLPVSSIVRLGNAVNNLRYLHCSLCNTEWNLPRATCTACGQDKSVALHEIEGGHGAVRAETCDECHAYLKLMAQDKDPLVDPVADDLATLALDLLVDQAGYERSGPNLWLIQAGAQT